MNQTPKKPKDPQIIVLLRVIGGGYLLYLAWGLRTAAFSGAGIVYSLAMTVFALAGAVLLFFSLRQLIRKDFLYPWQTEADFEDSDDTQDDFECSADDEEEQEPLE